MYEAPKLMPPTTNTTFTRQSHSRSHACVTNKQRGHPVLALIFSPLLPHLHAQVHVHNRTNILGQMYRTVGKYVRYIVGCLSGHFSMIYHFYVGLMLLSIVDGSPILIHYRCFLGWGLSLTGIEQRSASLCHTMSVYCNSKA